MKKKIDLTINTNLELRTPISARNNQEVIFSGKGSGAVISNRRGRFWNTNAQASQSGKKSVSPSKKCFDTNNSSSKKYNPNFVHRVEHFQQEIDEFKLELDSYLSSP